MIMSEQTIPIPGRLKNVAIGGHVAGSEDIDAGEGKTQKQVNDETNDTLALHQSEISGLNSQNYVSVSSYSSLPATGSADTIYRVSSWDGNANSGEGAADVTKYTEYAWNGTAYIVVSVKTQIGEVFDISEYKAVGGTLATFENLSAALDNGNNVPAGIRKGGMSVKFVQSSDNKYVQFRCMAQNFTTDVTQWQGVDDEPTARSNNLVKSSGVFEDNNMLIQNINSHDKYQQTLELSISGYINSSGSFVNNNSFHCTHKIYLDNVEKIYYRTVFDNTGYTVAFFNDSDEIIPSLSILGNPTTYTNQGELAIDNSYINAKYFIISHYGNITYTNAIVLYKTITFNELRNNIYTEDEKLKLEKIGFVLLSGFISYSNDGRFTDMLISKALPRKINYSLALDTSGYIVAFFDKNKEILSNISLVGNANISIQTGTIDLNDNIYDNVTYVVFSTATIKIGQSYVKADETDFNNKIKSIAQPLVAIELNQMINSDDEPQKYTFDNDGCILYNTGSMSGGGYHTNQISIQNISNIIVHQKNIDSSGAVIAFFDSNNNYLKNISVPGPDRYVSLNITDEILNSASYFIASTYGKDSDTFCTITYHSYPKPFLYGKHFCALGDSITDGDGNRSYSWYDMLLRRYNSLDGSLNFGISGSCLRAMADFCTAENMANIDICFVMGGTNQLSNYRLGTINDDPTPDKWEKNTAYAVGDRVTGGTRQTSGTSNWSYLYWYECTGAGTSGNTDFADGFPTTTDETFTDGTVTWKCIGNPSWYSDMKRICTKVWGYNPKIQIIWMIPIKRKSDVGKTPEQYTHAVKFNAIRSFCEFNSIRMIDLQKEFPLNEYTQDAIMADNLHPNDNGYKIIQDIICSHIE